MSQHGSTAPSTPLLPFNPPYPCPAATSILTSFPPGLVIEKYRSRSDGNCLRSPWVALGHMCEQLGIYLALRVRHRRLPPQLARRRLSESKFSLLRRMKLMLIFGSEIRLITLPTGLQEQR